jgi:hypothetical protein
VILSNSLLNAAGGTNSDRNAPLTSPFMNPSF